MKRLIISEEERRSILLRHGSPTLIKEAADADIIAIQTKLGLKADGVAGPKTVNAILAKLGGTVTPASDVTTQSTTVAGAAVTTQSTTVAGAAVTTQSTTVAGAAAATTGKFSAVPVAGAATLEAACGDRKTNKDFRLCRKVFKKTT